MVRHQPASCSGTQTQLRPTQEGLAAPWATHTLAGLCKWRPVLSALAKAWIPSHICTARMKACNCHRIQFFESEQQINVCFIFLFEVIRHHLVVRKAWAIKERRGQGNDLKSVQRRPATRCGGVTACLPHLGSSLRKSKEDPRRLPGRQFNSENKTALHFHVLGGEL